MSSRNKVLQALIASLAREGERAIYRAYSRRTYNNRTGNLHDSYGSAVFVNGVLDRNTIKYVDPIKASFINEREMGDYPWKRSFPYNPAPFRKNGDNRYLKGDTIAVLGRKEVYRFFLEYEKSIKGQLGVDLVVVAAMFYAGILEKGGGRLRRKYKVISGAGSIMRQLQHKYGGNLYRLNIHRDWNKPMSGAFQVSKGLPISVSKLPFK